MAEKGIRYIVAFLWITKGKRHVQRKMRNETQTKSFNIGEK
jgi:hypothetical protein